MPHFYMSKSYAMTMPDRLIPILSFACAVMTAAYIGLVVTTILFATLQTQLASGIRDTQATIASLETSYYSSIAKLDSTNPYSAGYVRPHTVLYVAAGQMPDLSYLSR